MGDPTYTEHASKVNHATTATVEARAHLCAGQRALYMAANNETDESKQVEMRQIARSIDGLMRIIDSKLI